MDAEFEKECEQMAYEMHGKIEASMALMSDKYGRKYLSLAHFAMKRAILTVYDNAVKHEMEPGKAITVLLELCSVADRISDQVTGAEARNQKN